MEQQSQQSIQEQTRSKPSIKINWKFITIVVIASSVVGILLLWYVLEYLIRPLVLRDLYLGDPHEAQIIERQKQEQERKIQELNRNRIDTSNWQTYRNEEFGFEVKYP